MHLQLFLHQCQKPNAPPGRCLSLLLVDPHLLFQTHLLALSQPLNLLRLLGVLKLLVLLHAQHLHRRSHNGQLQTHFEVPHLTVLPQTLPWEIYKLLQPARSQPWL